MLIPAIFTENYVDRFINNFASPELRRKEFSHMMKTDVIEKANGFEIEIELPGYKKEDVNAELKDGTLTIHASHEEIKDNNAENSDAAKEAEKKEAAPRYLRRERFYGSCSRSFYVGEDITNEDIKARFEDGILKIFVPKKDPEPEVEENHQILIEG